MQTFIVGGAVRDHLLGLPVQDRDHVVVGATPEEMIARGYVPVGSDFPVFLHPHTKEEYALARTERKTTPGYKGFVFHAAPDVTLEEDLVRRDLTINAMAQAEDGTITDPFGGQHDLAAKIFRHVSHAFVEDPVRILRVARFAARFADFTVAPATNALMHAMVDAGEVDALVPERVWQELARGLMEARPARMFEVLRACGALARILPELNALWDVSQQELQPSKDDTGAQGTPAVDAAARQGYGLPVRFAVLMREVRDAPLVEQVCRRLKIPNDCRDLAVMTARDHGQVARAFALRPATIVALFERSDAFRRPQRFVDLLHAAECGSCSGTGFAECPFPQAAYLEAALQAARAVDAGKIATETVRHYPDFPQRIPEAIRAARIAAVAAVEVPLGMAGGGGRTNGIRE